MNIPVLYLACTPHATATATAPYSHTHKQVGGLHVRVQHTGPFAWHGIASHPIGSPAPRLTQAAAPAQLSSAQPSSRRALLARKNRPTQVCRVSFSLATVCPCRLPSGFFSWYSLRLVCLLYLILSTTQSGDSVADFWNRTLSPSFSWSCRVAIQLPLFCFPP